MHYADQERSMNRAIKNWVEGIAEHTRPESIHWCEGSEKEAAALKSDMLRSGTLLPLHGRKFPGSYLHRSHPSDVARSEHLTFIVSEKQEDVGPNNNWMHPANAEADVWPLFSRSMAGRTMFVVPYLMGPQGSPQSRVGVQLTDSPYVALSLGLMTRMGNVALRELGESARFVKGVHSLGDLSPDRRFVLHFPAGREIWSIGSGYGGNALLSKKCHALRIASVEAAEEGWLAEHMMIVGITNPKGVKHYIAAAFPSSCGKTNLAMLVPSLPGWKVETIGDDICWMRVDEDGRLWAINPEAGFFGVAPGTSEKTNPNAMAAISHDTIFTNVALRADGSPWWEGMDELLEGEELSDWRGEPWRKGQARGPAAHPNARFTVAASQCPTVGAGLNDPRGVPISAIVFGGRRARVAPLVYESRNWEHGVYVGATLASETTAAATGQVGVLRNDPMAMLPFCGYNMGDYFGHWLSVGRRLPNAPRIFHVNWFRSDENGKFLWPGFGNNIRVLQWILDRVHARVGARETAIGHLPYPEDLNLEGLHIGADDLSELLSVDRTAWLEDLTRNEAFLQRFGERLPEHLQDEHRKLRERLVRAQ
ncbi:MAG: phosphoenolpyruvate carboxykinase (GTP) [Polyangiaceae bacterium]|nr:phosphoenolpyruvate carboxykinase (GTP) [Polyangiaceae bacterium]